MAGIANKGAWALAGVLGLLLIAAAAQVARGGPLDPPAPPGSTMKTLDEVEPRTPIAALPFSINQPGSYYVTENLAGVAGQHGITINAPNVTLDLGGFTLTGVAAAQDGIHVNAFSDVVVRNGMVRLWPGDGIDAADSVGGRFEDLTANVNGQSGIRLSDYAVLSDCVSYDNGLYGVDATSSPGSIISRCEAMDNDADGFLLAGGGSVLQDCLASANAFDGIVASGATITNCRAEGNGNHGISLAGSLVEDCTVIGSGQLGISAGDRTTVRGCHVSQTGTQGIHAFGFSVRVTGNTVVTTPSDIAGIWMDGGLGMADGNYVADAGYGIYVEAARVAVENNTIVGADQSGIFVAALSTACAIEGNTVNGSLVAGYSVAANLGCTVVRNVALGNTTNYSIGASNNVGPITTSAAQTSPAGNTAQ